MKWITDDIRERYEEWKKGECIFISAPTGSGKTYFVLNVLRPFLIRKNKKALYLVNRRILKDQIEKEMERIQLKESGIRNPIVVKTYQSIEKEICRGEFREGENDAYKGFIENKAYKHYEEYSYVVCDECHYFLTDSNYNANTALSFRFIQEMFYEKIRIFMSATIGDIKEYIKKDNWKRYESCCTPFYKFCPQHTIYMDVDNNSDGYDGYYRYYGDKLERDYGYLDIGIVKDAKEIIDLINNKENSREKWFVFVDSIKFGEDLEEKLKKSNGNQVVFVTSGYKYEAEALNEVTQIIDQEMQSARILIATSVLDNGINIKDVGLRNIVIMADTETEFIQSLGRKRKDGGRLKLYIYKHDKNSFVRRREQAAKQLQIIQGYLKEFDEQIRRDLDQKAIVPKTINWEEHGKTEKKLIRENHIRVMRDIVDGRIRYEDARKVFCIYGGILYVNLLAYQNLQNLYSHYENIIESLDKDDDAFVRKQLSWLGLAEEEVNSILLGEVENSRLRVIKALEEQSKKESVGEKGFIDFKMTIRADLRVLLKSIDKSIADWNKVDAIIWKNDRPLTATALEFLNEHCKEKIPYTVEEKEGMYTVKFIEESIDDKNEK